MKKDWFLPFITISLLGFCESVMVYFLLISHTLMQRIPIVAYIGIFIMWGVILYNIADAVTIDASK